MTRTLIAIVILTALAYGLRTIGTNSSVAYLDDTQIVRQSMEVGQRLTTTSSGINTLFSNSFKYPLTLTYYLTGVFGALFALGRLTETFESVIVFQDFLFSNRELIHTLAVLAFNLISVILIPAIFWASRLLNTKHSGWLAAGLATFNLLLVHFGHQPRPHVPLATLSFCAVVLQVLVAHRYGGWRIVILMTIVSALTVGTLQNGILIVISFIFVWMLRPIQAGRYHWREWLSPVVWINFAIFAGLCLSLYPSVIEEYGRIFISVLSGQSTEFLLGGTSHDFSLAMFAVGNVPQFASRLFSYQPLLTLLLIPSLIYFIIRHRKHWRLLVICLPFPLLNLILWALFQGTFPRITAVLIPFMIFAGAFLLEDLVIGVSARLRLPTSWLQKVVFMIILFPLAISAGHLVWITSQTDTRTQTVTWIQENIDEQSTILLNFQLNNLIPTTETIQRQRLDYAKSVGTYWQWIERQDTVEAPQYTIFNTMYWNDQPRTDAGRNDFIADNDIRYVVVRTLVANPTVDDMITYAQSNGKLIYVACPAYGVDVAELPTDLFAQAWQQIWTIERAGPYVAIYDLTLAPDEPAILTYCQDR